MRFRFLLALGLVLVGLTRAASPDQDPAQFAKLVESRRSLEAKKPQEALQLIDEVIAFYDRVYRDEKAQLYCARTQVETVRYLVGHVAGGKPEAGPPAKKEARVVSSNYADAYYMRSYALVELRRIAEAEQSLQKAIELSPENAQYLGELAYLLQLEKKWEASLALFGRAAEAARVYSPEELKVGETTRALRGQGYCLVEMGRWADAEAKYQECLKLNPNDRASQGELKYIAQLKAKPLK